jgi:hypothetical protein
MPIVTVNKLRGNPPMNETVSVDSNTLGEKWCSFIIITDFCKVAPYFAARNGISNNDNRVGYNGTIYSVKAGTKSMIYDSNYDYDNVRFQYVRQFVDYVLGKYKYGKYE